MGTIVALGTAQTIAWASSYYMPAILAVPIARDLGVQVHALAAPELGRVGHRLTGRSHQRLEPPVDLPPRLAELRIGSVA